MPSSSLSRRWRSGGTYSGNGAGATTVGGQKWGRKLATMNHLLYVSPYNFAIIYAGFGELDLAFTCLEQTYEERSNWLVFLRGEPRLDCFALRPALR